MKKKILFIMHMPPPIHGAAVMGQYIHDSTLINNEFECYYINPSASESIEEVGILSFKKILFFLRNLHKVIKSSITLNPDLIYITPSAWDWGFYRDWVIVMLLKITNKKIVLHYHNKGVESFEKKWYNKLLYRLFFYNVNTIFLSKKLVPEFEKYLSPDQIHICPNGIKQHVINKRENKHIKTGQRVFNILFLSNMMKEKGVYTLLNACRILKDRDYRYECHFIGKWADISETEFNHEISNLDLSDRVFAHGAKYGDEKCSYFEHADVLTFPTYYHGETFGLVLLEAMEYSLPVIGSNVGGISDVIDDGATGFVIKPGNEFELAERIAYLMNNLDVANEMGLRGREKFLREYTYDVFEKNMYNILTDCINDEQ